MPTKSFNEGEQTYIEVTGKSTSPYRKELKGKFNIIFREGDYKVEDKGQYVLLTLNVDEKVNVSSPEVIVNLANIKNNLQPDMTNTVVKKAISSGFSENANIKLILKAGIKYEIKFFKTNSSYTYKPGDIIPVFNY